MNQNLIISKEVLRLIPVKTFEFSNRKSRIWTNHAKHVAFILQLIEKSGESWGKACKELYIPGLPAITQQFTSFRRGEKTSGEKWPELIQWKTTNLRVYDFSELLPFIESFEKEACDKAKAALLSGNFIKSEKAPLTKYIALNGKIVKQEIIDESSSDFRSLIIEILDGKHPNLQLIVTERSIKPS